MPELGARLRDLVDSGATEVSLDEIFAIHDQLCSGQDAPIVDGQPVGGSSAGQHRLQWGRRRGRRVSVLFAAALVVAVAVASGIALIPGGGREGSVRTASGAGAVASNPSAGVSVRLPSGWRNLPRAKTTDPRELLVVGNAKRPTGDPIEGCLLGPNRTGASGSGSVYVSIYEYVPGQPLTKLSTGVPPVGSGPYDASAIQPQPADFATVSAVGGAACNMGIRPPPGVIAATTPPFVAYLSQFLFRVGGRVLLASIASSGDPLTVLHDDGRYGAPDNSLFTTGLRALNTLAVSATRGKASTAPKPRATVVIPAVTTTTPTLPRSTGRPPRNPAEARKAIQAAYVAAFGYQSTPQQVSDAVEGGFQLSPAMRAQGPDSRNTVLGPPVRITALRFVDQTHAAVNFALALYDVQTSPITPGMAVLVDGTWKVARATYCGFANREGYTCPP
jgi:hypothetical protein